MSYYRSIVFALFAIALLASAYGQNVRVVKADRLGVTFEYTPSVKVAAVTTARQETYTRVKIEQTSPLPGLTEGEPELYARSVPVRLPGVEGNSLKIENAEYEDIGNVTLQPVPAFRKSDVDITPVFEMDKSAYSVNAYNPEQLARLIDIGEARGVILGTVLLSPVQYNPATRTLRKYTRIVVSLTYGSPSNVIAGEDAMSSGIALNEESFTNFKNARTRATNQATAMQHSVLATGTWYRFPVTDDGMYKITGSVLLAGGIPAGTNPMNIKLYNNGGTELPESVIESYIDDLREIAVYTFDAGANNRLDADDYIIFYGKSVRGWKYTRNTRTFSHYTNRFTETNIYWLTIGATASKQMSNLAFSSSAPQFAPATINGKYFRDDDKINVANSGLEWLGQQFNNGESFTYVTPLPGIDISTVMTYKFTVGAQAKLASNFNVFENSAVIRTTPSIPATDVDNYDYYFKGTNPAVQTVTRSANISDEQSRLRFTFTSGDPNGYGYLNWFEIFYKQYPRAQNDVFAFHAHDTTMVTRYNIAGFATNQVFVFDVTRFDSVLMNANPPMNVDTCSVTLQLDSGYARSLYAVGKNSFRAVSGLTRVANQDLHGDTTEVEEIIITHSDFMSAAYRLQFHRQRAGTEYLKTSVVDIEKIYNEFGGGLPSPRAVRNYLKYLYSAWSRPAKYVLLLGDGDFDYRGILVNRANKIPVWETGIEFHPIRSYATDDDFVIFTSTPRVSMGIGRIPATTLSEANAVVDKIIEYESQPIHDSWRLKATLVADDSWTGSVTDGMEHSHDLENLSTTIPPLFDTKKIFLYEYPVVFTSNGRRKPAVNEAIRNEINQGTALLNFAGHGNPRLWTHEQVFVRETDFPLLSNKGKYFFLVAATCNYSAIDMLNEQSGGELLMLLPNAGAIATYCATRPVYAIWNADLNYTLYQKMFTRNSAGYVVPQRLGDIIYKTRQNLFNDNDRKFILLGDPALRLAFPSLVSVIDSVNGVPGTQTAQFEALSNSSIMASVRDTAGNLLNSFSGSAEVIVYDGEKTTKIIDPEIADTLTYKTNGNVIFRGKANIVNGVSTTRFIVPKDISYSNDYGKVTVYFSNETSDGAGYTTNVRIGGTDTTAETDDEGPAIRLYLDRRTFRSGDLVSANPLLIADVEDEHGINTSGAGVGHRIEAWLDNSPQSIDVTSGYSGNLDTYKEGTIEYRLNNLSPGSHQLRLRVWDTYNNSSQATTAFDVLNSVGLQLTSVFNFPNPFSASTVFSIEHNQFENVDAEIKIYTVAGRLIQSLEVHGVSNQIVNIPWDGRDRDGDEIANGIYLYKAIVKTSDRRLSGESYGKLSVLK